MATENRNLDIASIPPDTCPVCHRRALKFEPIDDGASLSALCEICGSRLILDPATRRSQHVNIAEGFSARYPEIASRLLVGPLTRRQVFELTAPTSWQPSTGPGAPVSSALVWLVLIAAGLMVAIVCACTTALLLSPGIAQTRQMIAAASTSGASALHSGAQPIGPLESPLQIPAPDTPAMRSANDATNSVAVADGAATATVSINADNNPPAPTTALEVEVATLSPDTISTINPQSRAILPPADQSQPLSVETPADTSTPAPHLPTDAAIPSPAETPTPEATPPALTDIPPPEMSGNIITGPIAITTIRYLGDPNINEADEFVEITNQSGGPIDLSNWTLRAVSTNRVYTFSNGMVMFTGDTCRVYTNSPVAFGTCGTLTFGADAPVWSNSGDVAELRDGNGVLVSRWVYVSVVP
ncbi:MAG: lamin tail domain-containing protein [Candidatus Roseilinea sp.]|uniref:lamin tail domain-containing protein n=1 Tax=Candidatus Roseilinea sp. TaxID=2838777 RepID=UPI00404B734D